MSTQIVTYPNPIRDLCGIDTIIFTYSTDVAYQLRRLVGDDFQIIYHNLTLTHDDELDWLHEALYHTHIFIVTESDTPFSSGYALSYATEQNPELVIGLNLDPITTTFLEKIIKDDLSSFTNISDIADFIEEQ